MSHKYFGAEAADAAALNGADLRTRIEAALRPLAVSVGLGDAAIQDAVDRDLTRRAATSAFKALSNQGVKVEGRSILDLGAGLGQTSVEAVKRGGRPVAVEPGRDWCGLVSHRLREVGVDTALVADGENLPFRDCSFDIVMSVFVLEHVRSPGAYLSEAFRVLKPGGFLYLGCENYICFREAHYQVAWLPLLPKRLGALYLRLRGRSSAFLLSSITYTTRPGVVHTLDKLGFLFLLKVRLQSLVERPDEIRSSSKRMLIFALRRVLPARLLANAAFAFHNAMRLFKPTIVLVLKKPEEKLAHR